MSLAPTAGVNVSPINNRLTSSGSLSIDIARLTVVLGTLSPLAPSVMVRHSPRACPAFKAFAISSESFPDFDIGLQGNLSINGVAHVGWNHSGANPGLWLTRLQRGYRDSRTSIV
ncbi:hypothetical protein [Burkholderia sp. PAMC 26561]|uniref:hypothetical protein n=1 Tax=Burkholderia sp. PAMC 26561 TaxID=1795043 RepID=UPI0013C4ED80|nr:hypothetical protein [Burkholderia sp. PAMC 26561]